jgi:phage terminase small subunit
MSAAVPLEPIPVTTPADLFDSLTYRQKSFADLYIEHRNATLAAKLAGYEGNDVTLASVGYENLRKPQILAYIKQKLEDRHLSSERVLAELSDVAAYSLDSIAVEGSPVKTQDKLKALELVGKFHKLFTDRVESEPSFSESDIERLGASLLSAMLEASARMRVQGAQGGPVDQQQLGPATTAIVTTTTTDDNS